jgi:hypothetical protein
MTILQRLWPWPRDRDLATRLQAVGFSRYDRAQFASGTRGAAGRCIRHGPVDRMYPARWQRRGLAALLPYCTPCARDILRAIERGQDPGPPAPKRVEKMT